mmetsp:Transcript_25567/g.28621  ORF Transcript_25567/g.28621 Transcript_25567/m.28621 type:complete len:782 (+) Transcript_25567:183-2528(+)
MDRQLLARSTENSDAPTPGYMYLDIAKNAAGNPQTCADIAKYLTGRLASKNNSNVKFKCLKVISKTAVSPYLRGQFKRCLSQDPQAMSAIKDATQFRGPPDPVRGDEPYDKVRKAAKEALDAVYSDTQASDPSMGGGGGSFASSVSSSYGNSAGGGYGSAPISGPRRMEGIGNPMFKDPRLEPEQSMSNITVNAIVNEAKSTVIGMIKDPLARKSSVQMSNNQGSMPRPGGSYSGPAGSFSRPPPGRTDLMHQTNGEWTMASNRGLGATAPPPNYANDSAYYKSRDSGGGSYNWAQANSGGVSSGVGGSWASAANPTTNNSYAHESTPSITVNSIPGAHRISGGGGTAVTDGSYERQLVMELCPPGGMKPEPPPDKLAQFARVVSSLNPDLVCPVLLDCLEEGQPWIIRAKALWVMDTCIIHGKRHDAPNNAYADFLHACHAEFAPLANHSRAAIQNPAKRVLNSLGVATPVGGAAIPPSRASAIPVAPTAPPPPPEPVVNLLDFDDEVAAPLHTMTPSASPQQSLPVKPTTDTNGSGGSLFGGLNMTSMAVAPVVAAPVAAPPAPSSGDNLLDLMAETSVTTASTPTEPKSSFGFMNSETIAPPGADIKETSNMFDNLSFKGNDPVGVGGPKTEPAFTAKSSESAFGFINSVGSVDSATAEKTTDVPPASATHRDSFDPLKNMTPNSQKQMMQVSPEQMQAMVYQQMMMQQQMQMVQMQKVLQQQNRGSSNPQMFMNMSGHIMQNPAASKSTFAFMDQPQKQEDKSFDFVKDAMTTEKKK